MRRLPTYLHVLLTCLLLGGYGAMYAGSISHDLGHMTEHSKLAGEHCDHHESYAQPDHEKHLEVSCFFCSHAPVLAQDIPVDQIWTPSVASLAPPVEITRDLHTHSLELPSLRGPPTA